MNQLTRQDVLELTGDGKFFSIEFYKRPEEPNKTQAALLEALASGDLELDGLGKRKTQAVAKLEEQGRVVVSDTHVSLVPVQPTKGEYRVYPTCRMGVSEYVTGKGKKFADADKNLITVFVFKAGIKPDAQTEMVAETGDYRSVPCENVTVVRAHKKVYVERDGALVEQE